jgi:hypothetical protein
MKLHDPARVVLIGLLLGAHVVAQQPPQGEAAKPAAQVPAAERKLTLEALTIDAAELPKGLVLVDGVHCVSVQAKLFFDKPEQHGILPAPVATASQSFAQGEERPGSILVLKYADAVPTKVRQFVPGLLWGPGGRSAQHPEEIIFSGEFLVVLSFPADSQAREWIGERLRTKCRLPVVRAWPELEPLVAEAMTFYGQRDAQGGLAFLRENAAKIKDHGFGQYLLGEFAANAGDWPAAEAAYARAVALHDEATDPLPNGEQVLWAALDGQAIALLFQDKNEESVGVLRRSSALAGQAMTKEEESRSLFNLACAYARLERFDEALATLTGSIELDEARREAARGDADFAEARKRPEFKALLAK